MLPQGVLRAPQLSAHIYRTLAAIVFDVTVSGLLGNSHNDWSTKFCATSLRDYRTLKL